MEETADIQALMDSIAEQETRYEPDALDERLAFQMGVYVLRRAAEMGAAVAVRVTLNRRTLFAAHRCCKYQTRK